MGCTTSCVAPSIAELNKSVKAGDERALLLQLAAYPKLLSSCTSLLSTTGITPFHLACENKQVKVVQHLITFLSCSSTNVLREALLPYCRRTGTQLPETVINGVRLAVGMINAKGQTPLMYACFADSPELVKLLLAHGADPWVGDRCGGRTALHYAALGGSAGCIQALLKHIPPRIMTREGNRYVNARSMCGLTPLHYCVYYGHLEAIRALLHHDPNINAATTSESYDVSVTCEVSSSPLHFAAVKGNMAAARELLQCYAQQLGSGTRTADPRTRQDATSQLPWQVAFRYHPANLELAALLHPGQPINLALGRGAAAGGATSASASVGAMPLVVIAAVALREKLLADLEAVEQPVATTTAAAAAAGDASAAAGRTATATATTRSAAPAATTIAAVSKTSAATARVGAVPQFPQHCHIASAAAQARSCAVATYIAKRHTSGGGGDACDGAQACGQGDETPFASCSYGTPVGEYGSVSEVECGGGQASGMPDIFGAGVSAADVAITPSCHGGDDDDDEGQCGLCFAAREEVAPAGCGHGICTGCARQLCRGMTRKPLQCPFCRRVVAGLVSHRPRSGLGTAGTAPYPVAAVLGSQ